MVTMVNKLFVFFLFILFVGCSNQNNNKYVAEVGNEKISASEFQIFAMQQLRSRNLSGVSQDKIDQVFENYINLTILAQLAAENGYDKRESYLKELEKKKLGLFAQYFYWQEMIHEFYSEDEVHDFFERMGEQFHVRHILVGYSGAKNSNVKRTREEAIKLINEIYDQAKSGQIEFSQLAREKSEGPSAPKGGLLPAFGVGKMVKPFEDAVFSMEKGEISEPVETMFGFHIIKVDDIIDEKKDKSLDDPLQMENLYNSMLSRKSQQSQKLFYTKQDSFKKVLNFSYNDANINWFSNELSKFSQTGSTPVIHSFKKDTDRNKVLFSYSDQKYTIVDFFNDFGSRIKGAALKKLTPEGLKKRLERFESLRIWSTMGKISGADSSVWFRTQINNFIRLELGEYYKNFVINPKITYEEADLKDFYERNISRYKNKAKIDISIIRQPDIEVAAEALKKAIKLKNWNSLVKKYSTGTLAEKSRNGNIGMRTEASFGDVSKKAFEFGPDKVIPELVLKGNTFYIVKTGKKVEESTKPFEKVKKDIIGAVKVRNLYRKIKEIVEEQKNTKKVKTNKSAINL